METKNEDSSRMSAPLGYLPIVAQFGGAAAVVLIKAGYVFSPSSYPPGAGVARDVMNIPSFDDADHRVRGSQCLV